MTTDVYTMDWSAFTSPQWAWSVPRAGTVDIDYTCSVMAGNSSCPSPPSGTTQPRQILLADISLAQPASGGTESIQYAEAYRDLWYVTPGGQSGQVTSAIRFSPDFQEEEGLSCAAARGRGPRSFAAVGSVALCAGMLAARAARRRKRPTGAA
jgi:hypothetical protein